MSYEVFGSKLLQFIEVRKKLKKRGVDSSV